MEIREKVALNSWTWWKIGGPADHFCLPKDLSEMKTALQTARDRKWPVTVLGGGTNVLVSDAGIEGLVIGLKNLVGLNAEERDGRLLMNVLAGTPKAHLTKIFLQKKLAPALFLCGLPGDVGGGLVMNAGISENTEPREFVEITDWIEVMNFSGEVKRFERADLQWHYRHCEGWQPGVMVRAGISWPLTPDPEIPRRVKEATKSRLARQPLDLPSCGSTFKNPPGHHAGALIEKAGLKGFTVGGAQVSPKHANFIVNTGGATSRDVRSVIDHVRIEVARQFGVKLETEVRFLGRPLVG